MFMKLKKATTAPPRTVGADPRGCQNNKEIHGQTRGSAPTVGRKGIRPFSPL